MACFRRLCPGDSDPRGRTGTAVIPDTLATHHLAPSKSGSHSRSQGARLPGSVPAAILAGPEPDRTGILQTQTNAGKVKDSEKFLEFFPDISRVTSHRNKGPIQEMKRRKRFTIYPHHLLKYPVG